MPFAGEFRNFDLCQYLECKEIRRNDLFTHLAVAASRQALEQAQLLITEQLAPHIFRHFREDEKLQGERITSDQEGRGGDHRCVPVRPPQPLDGDAHKL